MIARTKSALLKLDNHYLYDFDFLLSFSAFSEETFICIFAALTLFLKQGVCVEGMGYSRGSNFRICDNFFRTQPNEFLSKV